jgi:hypothetical protein
MADTHNLVEAHFGREVTSTVLGALEEREAWEIVVDAVCDAIPEASSSAPHEEFSVEPVLIEKLRTELQSYDPMREHFTALARALEARGFAIVRTR